MSFAKRLTYYGSGFIIGIIILLFLLNGKNASCDYMPNDRVLRNIEKKELLFSSSAKKTIEKYHLDSLDISHILKTGTIDFRKSKTKAMPCKTYFIKSHIYPTREIEISVINCKSNAKIDEIYIK